MNLQRLLAAALLLALSSFFAGAEAPPAPKASRMDPELAARLTTLAQSALRGRTPDETSLKLASSLLKAAVRLNAEDPAQYRLLIDTLTRTRDEKALFEAVVGYRTRADAPPGVDRKQRRLDDRVAQIEFIDLWIGQMATINERIDYLNNVLNSEAVPKEIRAEIALRLSKLQMERKQPDEARALVLRAIELNPLNLEALRIKFGMVEGAAPPAERVNLWVSMLRSNPAQPEVMAQIAETCADAGLGDESLKWYEKSARTSMQQGRIPPTMLVVQGAAQLYLAHQNNDARRQADILLEQDPEFYPALVVRILVEKQQEKKDALLDQLSRTRNAMINKLQAARKGIGGRDAATRPVQKEAFPAPNLVGDAELARKTGGPAQAAFLQALGDLAWFEVYFNSNSTEAARLLGVLQASANEDDKETTAFAARVQGWIFLADPTKAAEANVKLSAVADRDIMARVGLLRLMDRNDKEKLRTEASKLLAGNAGGLQGAILYDAVRDFGVRVQPGVAAEAIRAELGQLPADWLRLLDNPQAFYTVRGEPLKVMHSFGEPLLARVTVSNISQHPITIGPEGVIKPDVWFEVQPVIAGQVAHQFRRLAVDRITDHLVLRPRASFSRIVRLDQGDLPELMFALPTPPISFRVVVRTNPMLTDQGVLSSACGYRMEFGKPIERAAAQFGERFINDATAVALGGNGPERIRAMEHLASLSMQMRQAKDEKVVDEGKALLEPMRKARNDPDASVRAWSGYLLATYGLDSEKEQAVERLLLDEAWQARLVGVMTVGGLPEEKRKPRVEDMAKDADEIVKQVAACAVEILRRPPATQPAAP